MSPDTIPQTVLFPDLFDKPLFASSDSGAILLKAAERTYGLVKALAGCLFDTRAPDKIRHTLAELFGQRIFGIACGHPDCNDAERLADDPIHKLLFEGRPGGRMVGNALIRTIVTLQRTSRRPACRVRQRRNGDIWRRQGWKLMTRLWKSMRMGRKLMTDMKLHILCC